MPEREMRSLKDTKDTTVSGMEAASRSAVNERLTAHRKQREDNEHKRTRSDAMLSRKGARKSKRQRGAVVSTMDPAHDDTSLGYPPVPVSDKNTNPQSRLGTCASLDSPPLASTLAVESSAGPNKERSEEDAGSGSDIAWDDDDGETFGNSCSKFFVTVDETTGETAIQDTNPEKIATDETIAKAKKRKKLSAEEHARRQATRKSKELAQRVHRMHIVVLASRVRVWSDLADDEFIQALVFSRLPNDLHYDRRLISDREGLTRILSWFTVTFHSKKFVWNTPPMPTGSSGEVVFAMCQSLLPSSMYTLDQQKGRILQVVREQRGTQEELTVVLVALFRALGLNSRYVSILQPTPLTGGPWEFGPEDLKLKRPKTVENPRDRDPITSWVEVFIGDNDRWVCFDWVGSSVDDPLSFDSPTLAYVVAVSKDGIRDVTRRYVRMYSKSRKLRVPDQGWWQQCLQAIRPTPSPEESDIVFIEDAELARCERNEAPPKSLTAFKSHPVYVLEEFLSKYEIIHPRTPTNIWFKGKPVFFRSDVKTLHSRRRWWKEGREIKEGEVAMKIVEASKLSGSADLNMELFGIWQTRWMVSPIAKNGSIPKNENGNVELWTSRHMPRGCVQVVLPHIAKTAKKMRIDYAPAMVGFEHKRGKSIPVIEGIVICEDNKEPLLKQYSMEQKRKEDRAKDLLRMTIISRWRHLIRGAVARSAVHAQYAQRLAVAETIQANKDIPHFPSADQPQDTQHE
eukprot:Rmarinus@m.29436